MSTNKTQHYQLHSWEAGDDFLRSEFNENFAAIDTALGSKPEIVAGSYTGDGTTGRSIELGFTPKAVFVLPKSGEIVTQYDHCGGLALPNAPVAVDEYTLCKIVEGGFEVSHASYSKYGYTFTRSANGNGKSYHFLAVK